MRTTVPAGHVAISGPRQCNCTPTSQRQLRDRPHPVVFGVVDYSQGWPGPVGCVATCICRPLATLASRPAPANDSLGRRQTELKTTPAQHPSSAARGLCACVSRGSVAWPAGPVAWIPHCCSAKLAHARPKDNSALWRTARLGGLARASNYGSACVSRPTNVISDDACALVCWSCP